MRGFIKPTRTVLHIERQVEDDESDWGTPTERFAPPMSVPVYGWAPPGAEVEIRELGTGVKRDLDLYTPTAFAAPRDRVQVAGLDYEVVGHPEDYAHGPFAFAPGYRINLKRVEG